MDIDAAVDRVYNAIFDGTQFSARTPEQQPMADTLTKLFEHWMKEKIREALTADPDPREFGGVETTRMISKERADEIRRYMGLPEAS